MNKRSSLTAVLAAVLIAATLCAGLSTAAFAAEPPYYICYASNDYRVQEVNKMTASSDGATYTATPTLSRGDKFLISDGKGSLWGNGKGEPVTVTDRTTMRYTVTFTPDSGTVTLTPYAPAEYSLTVTRGDVATQTPMTYRNRNVAFEEYVCTLDLTAGDVVTVAGADVVYGEKGIDADGIEVSKAGKYRFTFTADEDFLYGTDGDAYIAREEVPALYFVSADRKATFDKNAPDEAYRLTRDEDEIAFAQYRFASIAIPENDWELEYYIYDAENDQTFLPSTGGKLTVRDLGEYDVLFAPDHAYSGTGDGKIYTTVERRYAYYDGYYALGDMNGFTVDTSNAVDDAGKTFDEKYRFVKNEAQKDYDEYTLTLYVTDATLDAYKGRIEWYVTDGGIFYRKPNGDNIVIDRAGTYEVKFSPTHNYGRGYRYTYARVGDETVRETVYIDSAAAFVAFTAGCTSPEYSLDKTFVLTADIDLTGMTVTPARIFSGTFDGLYRKVTGIVLSGGDAENGVRLFDAVDANGTVERVTFGVTLDADGRNTAAVGENDGKLDTVTIEGSVDGEGYVGGLVAVNRGTVANCVVAADVAGGFVVGGVVGFNAGDVEDCEMRGTVNGATVSTAEARSMLNVGGIAGYSTGRLAGCTAYGAVGSGQGRYVGGVAGLTSGELYMCVCYGTVHGESNVGGIVGYYGRLQQANRPTDSTEQLRDFLDRYFGTDGGPDFEESEDRGIHRVYYCFGYGDVKGETDVGGIAGHAGAENLQIVACLSTGRTTAHEGRVGGIVGDAGVGTVSDCICYGEVIAQKDSYAGGIVGLSTGTVAYCLSAAYVEVGTGDAGGIAGQGGDVRGCVSNAAVHAGSGARFGLIAGSVTGSKEYNYYVAGEPKGIGGVDYGAQSDYAACGITPESMQSQGMLSDALYGLDPERFLAGETSPRYPVPRAFEEIVTPDEPDDSAGFSARFNRLEDLRMMAVDYAGKSMVTVTFFDYDFDAETYERLESFRLPIGTGLSERYPKAKEQDGYFTRWDIDDFSRFAQNTEVHLVFDRALSTLSSDGTARPKVLVEGKFYADTVLELAYSGQYIAPTFTRDGKPVSYGDVTVRYYVGNPEGVTVQLVRGSTVVDASYQAIGEYVVFTLPEGYSFLVVEQHTSLVWLWILLAALGGVFVTAAAVVTVYLVRTRRARKTGGSGDK